MTERDEQIMLESIESFKREQTEQSKTAPPLPTSDRPLALALGAILRALDCTYAELCIKSHERQYVKRRRTVILAINFAMRPTLQSLARLLGMHHTTILFHIQAGAITERDDQDFAATVAHLMEIAKPFATAISVKVPVVPERMIFDPDSIRVALQANLPEGLRMLATAIDLGEFDGKLLRAEPHGMTSRNDPRAHILISLDIAAEVFRYAPRASSGPALPPCDEASHAA